MQRLFLISGWAQAPGSTGDDAGNAMPMALEK
jgi:hypothetical protein